MTNSSNYVTHSASSLLSAAPVRSRNRRKRVAVYWRRGRRSGSAAPRQTRAAGSGVSPLLLSHRRKRITKAAAHTPMKRAAAVAISSSRIA